MEKGANIETLTGMLKRAKRSRHRRKIHVRKGRVPEGRRAVKAARISRKDKQDITHTRLTQHNTYDTITTQQNTTHVTHCTQHNTT